MTAPSSRPKVIIVGGGFGGLYAAKALADRPVEVTLIDRKNHQLPAVALSGRAARVLPPVSL